MIGLIYKLFALIDTMIYGLASSMFKIIFQLANTQFFEQDQITAVTNRVYIVVGVLMLFKLVISAVQYLVNPDMFEDKEKGLGGILKKTATSIVLIVIIPTVFQFLMALQAPIIRTLPSVILGTPPSQLVNEKNIGFDLSFQVLSTFVRPRGNFGGSVNNLNGEIHDFDTFYEHVTDGCPFSIFTVGLMDNCHYDYKIILSSIGGAFLCYCLLTMILDVAIRTIKLGVIQMLAPIPISSYIFSKDKLNKFVKTATTVYVDLFVRMGIIYFVIFALQQMFFENGALRILGGENGLASTGEFMTDIIINVAIVFGLLMFASKAPKFITELLGLPDVGSGDLADMFKPAWQRVGGFASIGAGIGAFRKSGEYGEKTGKRLRRAFSASAHATATRLRDIASGKSLEESYKTAKTAANARTDKNLEYANRYPKYWGRTKQMWKERFDAYTGVTTGGEKANVKIAAANTAIEMRTHAWDRANAKSIEHRDKYGTTVTQTYTDNNGVQQTRTLTWAEVERRYKELSEGGGTETWNGEFDWLESNLQDMRDAASREYIRQAFVNFDDKGDNKTRNVFAEDILKIVRSGADKNLIQEIVGQEVKKVRVVKRDASGQEMFTPDGMPIYEIDPATGQPKVDTFNIDLFAMANKVRNNEQISYQEAEILSVILPKMDKIGGNIRLRETSTQTSVPKGSG